MIIDIYNQLIKKRNLTALYVLSAIVITYFASWFPDFENLIGIEGARISSVVSFGALNGMLLGPFWGVIASFTAIMGHTLVRGGGSPDTFHLLTPFFVAMSSAVAGLCITKREKAAMAIFGVLILLWYITPLGRTVYYYPWFHVITLGAFLVFNYKLKDRKENLFKFIFLLLAALMAILADHLAGSISAAILFDLPPQMFVSVITIYPIERMTLALAAASIMYLLIISLQNTLMESDTFHENIQDAKKDDILNYVNEVKDMLEKDKK
ncbi:hypothetical protein LI82_03660 [Methanococcoides methylutens]|uniref:Uncharacterized protein n=1 Tax=Methanococcoides methylutens TaxID=2226 RepID=A0A099T219_METMT|nr:hypothetical protein [Methanococcoides methylutens]KGK99137.1 hypothetical protein LI82_03660 [Methanococcoides methylutens]